MSLADTVWDRGMILAALSRSAGTRLAQYQFGPELPPHMRDFRPTGTGVGHVYIHVDGAGNNITGQGEGRMDRSVFDSAETAVECIVEIMKHATVLAALGRLDQWPQPNQQEWIKFIPVAGDYYGYPQHSGHKKKIKTCAINMRAHGPALFISSCYPDSFITV